MAGTKEMFSVHIRFLQLTLKPMLICEYVNANVNVSVKVNMDGYIGDTYFRYVQQMNQNQIEVR